jgi:hypothetical protein
MALPFDPLLQRDRYHCPDHFRLERNHPGIIAAWAIGLVVLVIAIGLLGTRLKLDKHSEIPGTEPVTTTAGMP